MQLDVHESQEPQKLKPKRLVQRQAQQQALTIVASVSDWVLCCNRRREEEPRSQPVRRLCIFAGDESSAAGPVVGTPAELTAAAVLAVCR